ncbi:ATPase associated with various cellular activities AAA_3 [Xylanimonas cellulosilytica DSM 15894]|uniref:ATPase associated with various cellular activities AAA_3 n=1 Tax=Xylanimonas cellulosilytica (strain DSM 15894 / JCM 12276 / CECT 5975 / KCTC 9989 / LMG 20990 / NBRC 107835 / XIL07) TaxID=446471 RepID=D1C0B6_XYLCX|nr:ATPase associated with various cellular activities AAA_3 [Xylanimonas cellulosilytica DSM 15894]
MHPEPAFPTLTKAADGLPQNGAVDAADADALATGIDELVEVTARVRAAVESVVSGRPSLAWLTVAVLLAEGHLLIEDVPGVGKTTLAKALARSVDCQVGRIQFTPDLLPSDLTGVNIFRAQTHEFEFRPGPVFNNIVIGDEINRASPKTQSALLECMEEGQTTVDGTSHRLPRPFIVVATQNPVEMEGTYPLPEAQRDRFTARLTVGYPDTAAELLMLDRQEALSPLAHLSPVTTGATVLRLAELVRHVHASPAVKQYVLDVVGATREHPALRLGASPRASLQLLKVAKASAAMDGREYVLPDDVQQLAVHVVAHRLILTTEARLAGTTTQGVVTQIVERTPVPAASPGRR